MKTPRFQNINSLESEESKTLSKSSGNVKTALDKWKEAYDSFFEKAPKALDQKTNPEGLTQKLDSIKESLETQKEKLLSAKKSIDGAKKKLDTFSKSCTTQCCTNLGPQCLRDSVSTGTLSTNLGAWARGISKNIEEITTIQKKITTTKETIEEEEQEFNTWWNGYQALKQKRMQNLPKKLDSNIKKIIEKADTPGDYVSKKVHTQNKDHAAKALKTLQSVIGN